MQVQNLIAKHKLKKTMAKRVEKLELKNSEQIKLYNKIKLMKEEKLMVKKKTVMGIECIAKEIDPAEKICIMPLREEILCVVDSPAEIKRLSKIEFVKLSEKMRQNILSTFTSEKEKIRTKGIIRSEIKKTDSKKDSFNLSQDMDNWRDIYLNYPYIRQLFELLIVKVGDKESISERTVKSLSEMMYFNWAQILQTAVDQQRLTCNRKLCIQHFPFKFEGVSCNLGSPPKDQVSKILHRKLFHADETFLNINFEKVIKRKDFGLLISLMPKESVIRFLIPSFVNYLHKDYAYDSTIKSLYMISAIFSCPYYPFSDESQLLKVSLYTLNCLLSTSVTKRHSHMICHTIGKIINKVEDKLPRLHRAILEGLKEYLSEPCKAYNMCYGILVAMKSMKETTIAGLLFETFEKMATFAAADGKHTFYFALLNVCELFVTGLIERKGKSPSTIECCVASQSLKYFGHDLILRLTPAFRRYEARIFKEIKYRFRKFYETPIDGKFVDIDTFFQDLINNPQELKHTTPKYPKVNYELNESDNESDEAEYVSKSIDFRLGFLDTQSRDIEPELSEEYCEYIKFLQNIPESFLDEKNEEILLNRKLKNKRTYTGDLSIFI